MKSTVLLYLSCLLFLVSCGRSNEAGVSPEDSVTPKLHYDHVSAPAPLDTIVFRHISLKKHRPDGTAYDINYEYPVQGPQHLVTWINDWLTVQAAADTLTLLKSPDRMAEYARLLRSSGIVTLDDALTRVSDEQIVRVIAAEPGRLLYGIIVGGERRNVFIDLQSQTGHLLRPVDVFVSDSWEKKIKPSLRRDDVKSVFLGKRDVVFTHVGGGWNEHVSYDRLWNEIEPNLRMLLQNKVTPHYVFVEQLEQAVKNAQDNFAQKATAKASRNRNPKSAASSAPASTTPVAPFRKNNIKDGDDVNYLYTPEGKLELVLHTSRSENGDVTTSIYNGRGDYQGKEVTSYASGQARTTRYNRNNQVRK
ncbi:MAG: hypothetical protein J6Y79_03815 [Paludibacteraceae bacterium]|nr:hypothetical protein [Paludibacteraceae bacterium]